MLGYAVVAVVFAIVTIAVPHMAADLVGRFVVRDGGLPR